MHFSFATLIADSSQNSVQSVLHWIEDYEGLLWALGIASLVFFLMSLFVIPAIVVRIRPDYFVHDTRPLSRWSQHAAWVRTLVLVAKNVLGCILILAGIAMLVLPGQGLLTICIGFLLIDFPRKYRLECWLLSHRAVHRPINWLRRRYGREPLKMRSR